MVMGFMFSNCHLRVFFLCIHFQKDHETKKAFLEDSTFFVIKGFMPLKIVVTLICIWVVP